MPGLRIALDYDGTYTADPELWNEFISAAQKLGHSVTVVTMRDPLQERITVSVPVIYTSRQAKRPFFPADIWIDDNPQAVDVDFKNWK